MDELHGQPYRCRGFRSRPLDLAVARWHLASVAIVIGALMVTSCASRSGDEIDGVLGSTMPTQSIDGGPNQHAVPDGDQTESDGAPPDDSVGGPDVLMGGIVFKGSSDSDFCRVAEMALPGLSDGSGSSLRSQYEAVADHGEDLLAVAPAEIRDDVRAFVRGVTQLMPALEQVDYDMSRVDDSDLPLLASKSFQTSSTRVVLYQMQVCHRTGE